MLGKVQLIEISVPNLAHLDISLRQRFLIVHPQKNAINDFDPSRRLGAILNIELLNERFYFFFFFFFFFFDLANWYFWALPQVDFPADLEPDSEKRRATGLIRLLTRLIFCWFLKEKGLIPEKLFHKTDLESILTGLDDDGSSYYQAILQNLFFATLNQRMGKDAKGQPYRAFALDQGFLKNRSTYDVNNLYRYESLFRESLRALHFRHPFLMAGSLGASTARGWHRQTLR